MSSSKPQFATTVFYLRTPTLTFDLAYYLSHHIPLCLKYWKSHGVIDMRVVEANPDEIYAYVVTNSWSDEEGWENAKNQKEEMDEIMGDVEKFTNGDPIFVVGKVIW
jgi:hypothetical protein